MKRLTVEAIEDPRGLRAFIRFPEILYRDDPCWVAPLRRDGRARLRPVRELLSYEVDVPPALPEAISRLASAASVRGVWVRSLDPSRPSAEAEAFRSIYNAVSTGDICLQCNGIRCPSG
jgi:hypothetical protein